MNTFSKFGLTSKLLSLVLGLTCLQSQASICQEALEALLVRKDRVLLSHIQGKLDGFSADEFILELQALHIKLVQQSTVSINRYMTGPLESRPSFDPNWLLKPQFMDEFNRLVTYFINDDRTSIPNAPEWLNEWESAFTESGGRLASSWTHKGRRQHTGKTLFLRRLLLEIGYRFQKENGVEAQPKNWDSDDRFSEFFANTLSHNILGNLSSFQTTYDTFHRRKERSRTPRTPYASQTFYQQFRRQMREVGISERGFRQWQPSKKAWQQNRSLAHRLDQMNQAIQAFGDTRLPLAGLFLGFSPPSESEGLVQWIMAEELLTEIPFLSYETLITRLIETHSPAGLSKQDGAKNWAQEILVQGAVLESIEEKKIVDYQHTETDAKGYINPQSRLWRESGFTLETLSHAIQKRVQTLELSL